MLGLSQDGFGFLRTMEGNEKEVRKGLDLLPDILDYLETMC